MESVRTSAPSGGPTVFTVGHSTRTSAELVTLLRESGVRVVADVRRFPASRRHPHFGGAELGRALAAAGIDHVWLGETLGGRRRETVPVEQSPNRAWTVPAFRHYADAVPGAEFQAGLVELEAAARERPTAYLCAEKLWWRCHRRILSDVLAVRGWRVVHLLDPGRASEHRLSEWARVEDGVLTYPALL